MSKGMSRQRDRIEAARRSDHPEWATRAWLAGPAAVQDFLTFNHYGPPSAADRSLAEVLVHVWRYRAHADERCRRLAAWMFAVKERAEGTDPTYPWGARPRARAERIRRWRRIHAGLMVDDWMTRDRLSRVWRLADALSNGTPAPDVMRALGQPVD